MVYSLLFCRDLILVVNLTDGLDIDLIPERILLAGWLDWLAAGQDAINQIR